MASTYLSRTLGTQTLATKCTISMWFKKSNPTNHGSLIFGNSNAAGIFCHQDGFIDVYNDNSHIRTSRLFRDVSAWYHIVVAFDTTLATASDRTKLYINGVRETSFTTYESYPALNSNTLLGSATAHVIGTNNNIANFFDGSMSHINFIDGTAYDASYFGSTDATTGEWKINTSPSVTYGNNGFFILKDGNSVTDQSPNTNNFTSGGSFLSKTEDNPSNVFATLNPLIKFNSSYSAALSKGNTTLGTTTGSTNSNPTPATLGMVTGKYYWETKFEVDLGSGTAYPLTGIMASNPALEGNFLGGFGDSYGYAGWNGTVYNTVGSTGNTGGGATYTAGDILSMAYDADNNRLYYYKNGAIQNSGTGIVIPAASTTALGAWFPAVGDWGDTRHVWSCNFGNGSFDGNTISTAGTNASGNGIFEYDVPTGYTALSTKGLNL